ncbi:hypothetical protein [Rhodoferax sp.]|uniref:hypothetical protein n=1 Tax=Rhodoferax sp. TaxID=50421 RepID=UPI00374D6C0D
MAFKFRISKVQKLPQAGVGVVDGTVLAGQVLTGQSVLLVHNGEKVPLRVEGVVMNNTRRADRTSELTLSFKLKQRALDLATAGDELVAA